MTTNHPPHYSPNEEVDIIGFFRALGNFFKKSSEAVVRLLKALFYFFVFIPYLYIKRHSKAVFSLLIATFIIGIILDNIKITNYKAEILVSPNYDSGKELYTTIEYFNSLIGEGEFGKLGRVLGMDSTRASAFISFEVEPNMNERITVRSYSEFSKLIDTTYMDIMEYDKYKESFHEQKFDYPQHRITVIASKPDVFAPLNVFFEKFLERKKIFQDRRNSHLAITKQNIRIVENALAQIDSLRKSIDRAIANMGKTGSSSGQNIIVGTSNIQFPEQQYDLFDKKKELIDFLNRLKVDLVESEHILILNSLFPERGKEYSPLLRTYKFFLPLVALLFLLGVFYFIEFIRFLDAIYRQRVHNEPKR